MNRVMEKAVSEFDETAHATEMARGERFAFGSNWQRFLEVLDEERIESAERSLAGMIGDLEDVSFLDIGSGSGLSSLAARRLGARVHSFDYDPQSVACTAELRRRFFPDDPEWTVEQGSALNPEYLRSLGRFDVVYSWGVLHHTGSMWDALEAVIEPVRPDGRLFIAIYNDQGAWSHRWRRIKRAYCSGPVGRTLVSSIYFPLTLLRRFVADVVWLRNPFARYRDYKQRRGMSAFHDMVDWLGGYPFEFAKPEEIFAFYRDRGFELEELTTAGGSVGCNQFVFRRTSWGRPPDGG